MTKPTVIRKANPNHHGWIKLLKYVDDRDDAEYCYVVTHPGDEDGAEFGGDLAAAEAHFESEVAHYAMFPNWEAQAEYDAVWGDPLQFPGY